MADRKQLALLKQGKEAWNRWRAENPDIAPRLRGADLQRMDLSDFNLARADLRRADLSYTSLYHTILSSANLANATILGAGVLYSELDGVVLTKSQLTGTNFSSSNLNSANLSESHAGKAVFLGCNLSKAKFIGASCPGADLSLARLTDADLRATDFTECNFSRSTLERANLASADLTYANFVDTDLRGANLTGCRIFGVSAWQVRLDESTVQRDLIINDLVGSRFTLDSFEVAQFVYLLINNAKIRDVIDTMTSKIVLILGNFSRDRKDVLDKLKEHLRLRGYLPIIFDFQKPESQELIETVTLLARMARFVVADLTEALSVRQELPAIVHDLPSLVVQPIIHASETMPVMLKYLTKYSWVLPCHPYNDKESLLLEFDQTVLETIEAKVRQMRS